MTFGAPVRYHYELVEDLAATLYDARVGEVRRLRFGGEEDGFYCEVMLLRRRFYGAVTVAWRLFDDPENFDQEGCWQTGSLHAWASEVANW